MIPNRWPPAIDFKNCWHCYNNKVGPDAGSNPKAKAAGIIMKAANIADKLS